jgi:uncharacterized membrane protein YccC
VPGFKAWARYVEPMEALTERLRNLIVARKSPVSVSHAVRTAAIVVVSFYVAKLVGLPEAYWAAITTLIVVQSPVTATSISAQYFAGTAVGAAVGGWAGTYFAGNGFVFGACVLGIGIFLSPFRVERSAYRYASITLAIVMLVPSHSGWVAALHRFLEVSTGIAVGLAISAMWPEPGVE